MPGEQVGAAFARISLDSKEFESGMSGAHSKFGSFASDIESRAGKLGSAIGIALKVGLVAGVAAIGTALAGGTKAFADYEQGVADLNKVMDGTPEVQADVANGMRELSMQSGTAVTSLLGVGASLSALGIGSGEVVQATKVVDQMGIALGLSNDEAASYLAGMNTLYGTSVDKWSNIASGINEVENSTSATAKGMLNFANEFAPIAKLFNITDKEALAFGATMEALKLAPAEAATSIKSAVTVALADDKKMTAWAELLKTDVASVKKALNEDLIGTLFKSTAALDGMTSSSKAATVNAIWGSYGLKSMALIGDATQSYTDNLATLNQGFDENVSIGREVETRNNTLYGSWNKVKSGINDLGISIGEVTSGPLKGLMDKFIELRPAIADALKAALSGDWSKFGTMLAKGVKTGWETLKNLGSQLYGWLRGVNWGGVGSYIVSAIRGMWSEAQSLGKQLLGWLKGVNWSEVGTAILDAAKWGLTAVYNYVKNWTLGGAVLSGVLGNDWSAFDRFKTAFNTMVGQLPDIGKYVLDKINAVDWGSIAYKILDVFDNAVTFVQNIDWSGVGDHILSAFDKAADLIEKIDWNGVGRFITTTIGEGVKALMGTALNVGGWLHDTISKWASSGGPRRLGEDIANALGGGINSLLGSGTGKFDFWAAVKTAFKVAKDWISLGWDIISGIGSGILGKIKEYLTPAQNQFVDFVKNVGDMFFGLGETIGTAIDTGLTTVKASLESLLTQLGRTVPYFAQMMGSTGDTKLTIQSVPQIVNTNTVGWGGGAPLTSTSSSTSTSASTARAPTSTSSSTSTTAQPGSVPTGTSSSTSTSGPTPTGKHSSGGSSSLADKLITGLSNDINTLASDTGKLADSLTPDKIKSAYTSTIDPNFVFKFSEADKGLASTIDSAKASWDKQTESWKWKVEAEKTSSQTVANTLATSAKSISTSGFDFKGFVDASRENFMNGVTIGATTVKDSGFNFKGFVDAAKDNFMMGVTVAAQTTASTQVQASGYAATALRLGAEIGAKFTTDAGQAVRLGGINGGTAIIGGANQGAAIGINATNQQAAVGLNSANQQGAIGINTANSTSGTAISTANTVSGINVSGAKEAATQFATGVGSAAGGLAAVLTNLGSFMGGYGGGGSSGGSTVKASNVNLNGADINGNFTDMTCLGDTVLVNGLKYTNPQGYTTYINPMTYQENGGISSYQGSGSSSNVGSNVGNLTGYKLPSVFAARGYMANEGPKAITVGERGTELVLPNDISRTIIDLTASGGVKGKGTQEIHNHIYLNRREIAEQVFRIGAESMQTRGLSIR